MDQHKISGRIGTRVVGVLELIGGVVLFGIWIWVVVINTRNDSKYLHEPVFFAVLILFGIYFMAGIVGGFLLVYATYSHASLKIRKNLAIVWSVYRIISFVVGIILMCTTKWFAEIEWFMLMIGLILKWVVFVCVVCTYIWRLSEVIEEKKQASSIASSTLSFNSKIAQEKHISKHKHMKKIQATQNYGAFITKKQFC